MQGVPAGTALPLHAPGDVAGAVRLDGLQAVLVPELGPLQEAEARLRLVALAAGQQALPPLAVVSERDGKQYSVLPPLELFVDSAT
jgi:hypothetical protein